MGEEGTLVSYDPVARPRPAHRAHAPGRADRRAARAPPPPNPYRLELEDFSAAIRGERQPRLGREDAVGQARTIEALYRAAAEGRAVEL